MTETKCPKCFSEDIYSDSGLWICPMCAHEWNLQSTESVAAEETPDGSVRDAFGNILAEGDSVTIIKDLKIKGATSGVKVGTKIKNIHLVDGHDGHNISCKIDGVGAINLKSEFVKKA